MVAYGTVKIAPPGAVPPMAPRGLVHHLSPASGLDPHGHKALSVAALAERLATARGYAYFGASEPQPTLSLYVVPDATLTPGEAASLGIAVETDLFGGVVPHAFMAGKSISHDLISRHAHRPEGWSPAFAKAVRPAVLRGYTAFSKAEAREAGLRLLPCGEVRLKPAWADGGRGQRVVADAAALEAALEAVWTREAEHCGLVLEENLTSVKTLSIGEIRFDGVVLSYFGTQGSTRDNSGKAAYGGSALSLSRGGFDTLLDQPNIDPLSAEAVRLARIYDRAADKAFPRFLASRRNYDVAVGRDASGTMRIGVLEQSWRIGGASGAEIAALAAFSQDPQRKTVKARCVEIYGAGVRIPDDAQIYFQGDDKEVGYLTKYAIVEARSYA